MRITPILLGMGLLFISVPTLSAQPKAKYSVMQRDLGILSWRTPGLAQFEVTNTGNQPLVLRDVQPDCGCTAVTWTSTPIRPGSQGMISVTYNSETLGRFDKGICVLTNTTDSVTYLRIHGNVVYGERVDTAQYTYKIGDIRLSTEQIEFDDVNRGDYPQQAIGIANMGKTSFVPELMHLPQYLSATAQPEILRPGKTGKIILTLNSELMRDMGLTQTSVYLSRHKGDRVGNDNEISVSAIMVPHFNNLTSADMARAPKLSIDRTTINTTPLTEDNKVKEEVVLTNSGKSTLDIRSLQVFHPCINVDLAKRKLEPGKSEKLRITLVGKFMKRSKSRLRILLTTNDPNHSKVFIDIKPGTLQK